MYKDELTGIIEGIVRADTGYMIVDKDVIERRCQDRREGVKVGGVEKWRR